MGLIEVNEVIKVNGVIGVIRVIGVNGVSGVHWRYKCTLEKVGTSAKVGALQEEYSTILDLLTFLLLLLEQLPSR